MVVVESDRYEENYELISSSQCIILNKISAAKNTVFLVKLVPCTVGVGRNLMYLLKLQTKVVHDHSKAIVWDYKYGAKIPGVYSGGSFHGCTKTDWKYAW